MGIVTPLINRYIVCIKKIQISNIDITLTTVNKKYCQPKFKNKYGWICRAKVYVC